MGGIRKKQGLLKEDKPQHRLLEHQQSAETMEDNHGHWCDPFLYKPPESEVKSGTGRFFVGRTGNLRGGMKE